MAASERSLAGWSTLAIAAGLAVGGAAARPGGVLLGVPSLAASAAVAGALGVFALWVGRERGAVGLGVLPLALLALLGLERPLTGPPLLAAVLAAGVAMLAQRQARVPRWLLLPAVFIVYCVASARVQVQVGPQGDEPHYLMVADSLLRDRDLSLEKDYTEGRYRSFVDGPLAPHYRVRGKHGEIYSLHAVGLSLLVLPAYALGGYAAASFFMALLAALLAREVRELTGSEAVAWTLALSPPLIHYAGLVFTEVPAALLVAFALRRSRAARDWRPLAALAAGVAIACLPWLNVRYAPLAALLLAYALWHRPQWGSVGTLLLPVVVSAAASALYHHALYGFFDPRRVYGRRPELSLGTLPEGLPGLLLDQEFGLLVYAPVFALVLPGLFGLWRRDRRAAVAVFALGASVLLTAGAWHMWRGGWNPPARFLLPLLPVLALALAHQFTRGLTASAALLIGWGLWTGVTGAWEPRLVHRDRDGTAPFFREHSGAEEWTRLLPGYVLSDPDRHRRALVWAVALSLAVLGRRAASAPRLAFASVGLLAAAAAASAVSAGRTGGRDAVRLVGRPALLAPGWTYTASADGRWGPDQLDWGPLYEPHRHPAGAPIGERLPLRAGSYRLTLQADVLGELPELEIRSEGPSPPRQARFDAGRSAVFAVFPRDRAVTLRLEGGGPLVLHGSTLSWISGLSP